MADNTGRFAMIEQFIADDIKYMYGNPGTVELTSLGEPPLVRP